MGAIMVVKKSSRKNIFAEKSLISFSVNCEAHVHPLKLTHKRPLPKTEV